MKTVLYVVGICFLVVDAAYLIWSLADDNFELIGLLTIGLSGVMCVMLAFYFGQVLRGDGANLAEDRLDAGIDDGDAEAGFFSPWSWWPVLLGGAISAVVLGLAISPWIAMFSLPLLLITIIGWQFEYFRGNFAH